MPCIGTTLLKTNATQALLANRTDIHTLLREIADVKKPAFPLAFVIHALS